MMSTKGRKPQKIISIILAAIILCSSIATLFSPTISNVNAVDDTIQLQHERTILRGLIWCVKNSQNTFAQTVNNSDINGDSLANTPSYSSGDADKIPVGFEINSGPDQDGYANCNSLSIGTAMAFIGKDAAYFFNLLYTTGDSHGNAQRRAQWDSGSGGFDRTKFAAKLVSLARGKPQWGIGNDETQRRLALTFYHCYEAVPDGKRPQGDNIKVGGKQYQSVSGMSNSSIVPIGIDFPDQTGQSDAPGQFQCLTIAQWSGIASALTAYPASSFKKTSDPGAPAEDPSGDASGDSSCQGGALGWILCPMIDLLSKTTTFAANMVDSLLQFRVLAQEADNGNETIRQAWQGILSIANIFLVLAFLIIIFSQSTSLGLSNYGIKRMLPRLILAAILINLSFFICAFLVDISNIIGSSVMGFLTGGGTIGSAFQSNMDQSGGFAQALVGGVAIVAIIFFFLLPVLLAVLLVLLLLIARLVILGVLIVVSPLAFAAWLLPNTESYFKKWWDLFTKLLFIYPVVMAVFGASLLFSKITKDLAPDGNATIANLISLAVLAIPLFVLPKILMSTNSMMGQVGGLGQKFNKFVEGSKFGQGVKARGRAYGKLGALGAAGGAAYGAQKVGGAANRKWGARGATRSRAGYAAHGLVLGAKKVGGAAATGAKGVRSVGDFDRGVVETAEARKRQKEADKAKRIHEMVGSKVGGTALRAFGGTNFEAYSASEREKAFSDRVGQIQTKMKLEDQSIPDIGEAMRNALGSGDHETVRAAFNQLSAMGGGGKAAVSEVLADPNNHGWNTEMNATINNAVNANYTDNVGKEGFIAKGHAEGGQFTGDLNGLSPEQLAGQTDKSLDKFGHTAKKETAQAVVGSDILTAKQASPTAFEKIEDIAT